MKRFLTSLTAAALVTGATVMGAPVIGVTGAKAQTVTVTGEFMDSWCYISQVGLIDEQGDIYFVLKVEDEEGMAYPGTAVLEKQSHVVTVEGELIERDGLKYLLIGEIQSDEGVVRRTHETVVIIPPFAAPN